MIRALILLFFILPASWCMAQTNLVPNPSFENTVGCPSFPGEIHLAIPWFSGNSGTPDYYHSCGSNGFSPPATAVTNQLPRTGNGFAGQVFLTPSFNLGANLREYIETPLASPLAAGKRYCAEFYVNLVDDSYRAIDGFGMYFSNDSLLSQTSLYFAVNPQVSNISGDIITEKDGWIKISGYFIAQGGERFLTIGNFKSDFDTQVDSLPSGVSYDPYYLIDDVTVYLCDTVDSTSSSSPTLETPNIFTPNGDGINDLFLINTESIESLTCDIYNRWGIKVGEITQLVQSWDGRTTSGQEADEGIYYYVLIAKDEEGIEHRRTGFVHLMR